MASTTYLQQAYLAYFGRPADVSGLSFYADKTEAQVVAAFSASETTSGTLQCPIQMKIDSFARFIPPRTQRRITSSPRELGTDGRKREH